MINSVKPWYGCLLLCSALALGGCTLSNSASLEEEKDPHFLEGKTRINTMDYAGAIESFEQALETNPKSAAAHFELGCLCDQKEADPARAIYHYGRYLKLRPRGDKVERARGRIAACQQELARTVSLGPVTQGMQHEQEALAEQVRRLTEENKVLREKLEKWEASASSVRPASPTPRAETTAAVAANSISTPVTRISNATVEQSRSSNSAGRKHTVSAGETPVAIAKRYGVRLETLMAANPRLEPRRMRVGQMVSIPSS